jgi:hypothetical protein
MGALVKHWPRILVTLLPLVFALLHAAGAVRLGVLERLDNIIYDSRLRATMPRTLDDRVVIVDIDEKSLAEVGRWPWGRNRLAELTERAVRPPEDRVAGLRRGVCRGLTRAPASSACASWHRTRCATSPVSSSGCARCSPRWTTTRCSPRRSKGVRWCWATT